MNIKKYKNRIIFGIVFVLVVMFIFRSCDKSVSKNFNGTFKKDDVTIKIYAVDENDIKYMIEKKDKKLSYGFVYRINNSYAFSDFGEGVLITLTRSKLIIESEFDNTIPDGEYPRVGNFSIDDFYKSNYGDLKYLNSRYLGRFEKNEKGSEDYINLYQPEEDTVAFMLFTRNTSYECEMKKVEDNKFACDTNEEMISIFIDDDGLHLNIDRELEHDDVSEIYLRKKKFNKYEIIETFNGNHIDSNNKISLYDIEYQ